MHYPAGTWLAVRKSFKLKWFSFMLNKILNLNRKRNMNMYNQ